MSTALEIVLADGKMLAGDLGVDFRQQFLDRRIGLPFRAFRSSRAASSCLRDEDHAGLFPEVGRAALTFWSAGRGSDFRSSRSGPTLYTRGHARPNQLSYPVRRYRFRYCQESRRVDPMGYLTDWTRAARHWACTREPGRESRTTTLNPLSCRVIARATTRAKGGFANETDCRLRKRRSAGRCF